MAGRWTSDTLLVDVAARAGLPDAYTERLSQAEILAIADDVIAGTIADAVLSSRVDYWVHTLADATITSGTAAYRLPARCLKPRDVLITDGTSAWSCPQVSTEERWRYEGATEGVFGGSPYAFCLEGNRIVFLPTPTVSTYYYRLRYWRRPSRLVLTSAATLAATVVGQIVTGTGVSWAGATVVVDCIEGTPEFYSLGDDLTMLDDATDLTFTALPSAFAVGDYIALANETPVPQVPAAFRPLLVAGTVAGVLEALGDDGAGRAHQLADRELDRAQSRLRDRIPGERKAVINRSSPWHGSRWSPR